ncbi:methylmalonyl-CoA epimerase [Ammoniphilus sp. YIM 78166]|uniref:methylmalonyl-CoA epimerase n=1 Tax=Ammoniphilus sp. YIM 78166 TaxID=1644106 RepID=UPI00106FE408|nr:methylmalonyl-CoA epimerase [Ammoniphilus sp. YIM 78166]
MATKPPKQIEHIGIAVRNLEESVRFYTELIGLKLLGYETVESEKVRVAFLEIGETRLELLEATSPESPIAQFIEKKGEGIHHIALQVDDAVERLDGLKSKGIKLIHEVPKEGAHGNLVAFLHPKSTNGVLLELCQPQVEAKE